MLAALSAIRLRVCNQLVMVFYGLYSNYEIYIVDTVQLRAKQDNLLRLIIFTDIIRGHSLILITPPLNIDIALKGGA